MTDDDPDRGLTELRDGILVDSGATGEAIGRLRQRHSDASDTGRLTEVVYRYLPSPIGRLMLAGTDRGLLFVAFECEPEDQVLSMLTARVGSRVLHTPGRLDDAARGIDALFARLQKGPAAHGGGMPGGGTPRSGMSDVELPVVDERLVSGFTGEVQRALADIPAGSTETYKQLASRLGRPSAVRAVGTGCATNPLPIVWPCHRVVRSDGGLGGYRGGLEAKTWLLEREAALAGA